MKGFRRSAAVTAWLFALLALSGAKRSGAGPSHEAVWEWLIGPVTPDGDVPRGAAICFAIITIVSVLWLCVELRNARRKKRDPEAETDGTARGEETSSSENHGAGDATQPTFTRATDVPNDVEEKRSSESRVASTNVIPGVVEDDSGQTQVIAVSNVELETESLVGTEALGTAGLLAGLASDGGAFTRPVSELTQEQNREDSTRPAAAAPDDTTADEFECTQVLPASSSPVDESDFECTQVLSAPDDDLECTQVLLSPLGKSGSPEDEGQDGELLGELEELLGKKLG